MMEISRGIGKVAVAALFIVGEVGHCAATDF